MTHKHNNVNIIDKSPRAVNIKPHITGGIVGGCAEVNNSVKVSGALFQAFVNAGESLRLLLWGSPNHAKNFDISAWYPLEDFHNLLQLTARYKNPGSILEQIGAEMTKCWYYGTGKDIITSSTDFIIYQTRSGGFQSVISGPPEVIGAFELIELDENSGTARIHSSTIFPREMECGILYGGLGLTDDFIFYDVLTCDDTDYLDIIFVTEKNRKNISWYDGDVLGITEWRYKHQINLNEKKEKFWQGINETLNAAFLEMKEAMDKVKVLRGLLPICSSCKKIRDDKGYWNHLEQYISKHSEADFTHGLCPACARRLYPNFMDE